MKLPNWFKSYGDERYGFGKWVVLPIYGENAGRVCKQQDYLVYFFLDNQTSFLYPLPLFPTFPPYILFDIVSSFGIFPKKGRGGDDQNQKYVGVSVSLKFG